MRKEEGRTSKCAYYHLKQTVPVISVWRFETGVTTVSFLFFLNYFFQSPAVTL